MDGKQLQIELFGPEGAQAHGEAMEALHRFAQQTGAPLGGDVIGWMEQQTARWVAASSAIGERERLVRALTSEDEARIRQAAGDEWDATVPRWAMPREQFVQWHVDMAAGKERT